VSWKLNGVVPEESLGFGGGILDGFALSLQDSALERG
jgi:hypothetical protein